MYSHKRESSREPSVCRSRLISRAKGFFTEHREMRDFLDLPADHVAQGEQAVLSKNSLKRNNIRDCFLKNRRIIYCLKHDPSKN